MGKIIKIYIHIPKKNVCKRQYYFILDNVCEQERVMFKLFLFLYSSREDWHNVLP